MTRCSWSYKLFLLGAFSVAYGFFYLFPNFFPLTTPRYLPLLPIDVHTPLIPWTFAIYLSDYLMVFVVIALIPDKEHFNSMARMSFGVLIVSGIFFLLFPTTYPRPPYPEVENPVIAFMMGLVAVADMPTNCFPSMHVAITSVAMWATRPFRTRLQFFFWLWGTLIFISTMTTKQHYLVDIFGGLGVMAFVATLEWALFQRGGLETLRSWRRLGSPS